MLLALNIPTREVGERDVKEIKGENVNMQSVQDKCHINEMTEESIGFDNWVVTGKHYQTNLIDYECEPG